MKLKLFPNLFVTRALYGIYIKSYQFTDKNNAVEEIYFNFYQDSNGVRTTEVDYGGPITMEAKAGQWFNFLARQWSDLGILPEGTFIFSIEDGKLVKKQVKGE